MLKMGVEMEDGAKLFVNTTQEPKMVLNDDVLFGVTDLHLVHVPELATKIHPHVVPALNKLIERAKAAGFALRIASGYRSFSRQLLIWNNKATGLRSVLDQYEREIDINALSDSEKIFSILRWSALPGASRHHWGTDVDVYDASTISDDYQVKLTLAETQHDGPFAAFHRWLSQDLANNSGEFYRPYVDGVGRIAPEPWHLSFAPVATQFYHQLTEFKLREKILATDIILKEELLKNLNSIFDNYVKPYKS